MKIHFFLITCLAVALAACTSGSENNQDNPENKEVKDSIRVSDPQPLGEGLELWRNMEQVEYCVPVPIQEYPLSTDETTRGQFLFRKSQDSLAFVELRGLFRTDPSVSLEMYFSQTYSGEEEAQGKLVSGKYLLKDGNRFWAEGTWSNLTGYRFLEITWLRQDDVVTMEALYPEADTAVWRKRRLMILSYDTSCE